MAFSYPEFHGRSDENIEEFLESMEVACISNHVHAPAQMLRLLQICLKGDAHTTCGVNMGESETSFNSIVCEDRGS